MKLSAVLAPLLISAQLTGAVRKLQFPSHLVSLDDEESHYHRFLMTTKPATTPVPPAAKGKGKGSTVMSTKAPKSAKASKAKGKGGEMSAKGKGAEEAKGKGGEAKGKGAEAKGKGGEMSAKGKGAEAKGKGGEMSAKGKGAEAKGKGSEMSAKSAKSSKSVKAKGKGKGMGMMAKGKGGEAKGKGEEVPAKGKGGESSKGKGGEMSSKGKGGESAKGKGGESAKGKGKGGESSKGKGKGGEAKGKGKGKGKGEDSLPTLADVITDTPGLEFFAKAMEESDLLGFFYKCGDEYTILAPTNKAFTVFTDTYPDTAATLFDDQWILHLLDLVSMHILEPVILSTDLVDGATVEAGNFDIITVDLSTGACFTPSVSGKSCVEVADVMACNGVTHIVDDVLMPFWLEFSVLDIVAGIPELSTLTELVQCAGLSDALATTFGITVFGPTNDAFEGADVDFLCSEEGLPTLIDVLTYHVLPKVLPSVNVDEGSTYYDTLQGKPLTVTFIDSKDPAKRVSMVNDANVIDVDYGAINGVVHLIDGILMPPAAESKGKGKGKGGSAKGKGKGGEMSSKGKGGEMSKGKGKGKGGERV